MGGSAEALHFPENDAAYDVEDSSDEDLDGMEAAVGDGYQHFSLTLFCQSRSNKSGGNPP